MGLFQDVLCHLVGLGLDARDVWAANPGKGCLEGSNLCKEFLAESGLHKRSGLDELKNSKPKPNKSWKQRCLQILCILLLFPLSGERQTDLFSRRFREGISFPNLLERSILKLPLFRLCAAPLVPQNRAQRKGREGARKGEEEGGQQSEQKGKRTWKQVSNSKT